MHSGGVSSSRQTSTFLLHCSPTGTRTGCPKYECSLPDSTEDALETTTLGDVQDGDSEDYYDTTATGIITKEPGTEETTTNVAASDETITDENDGNESVTEEERRIEGSVWDG